MFDITAIGELLVDFSPAGLSGNEYPLFEMNPGGAPANVAVGAARLGAKTAFIGKVGDDDMGHMLRDVLQKNGVDTKQLKLDTACSTMFTLVQLDSNGDRSFRFFRDNSAETNIRLEDISLSLLRNSRSLHVGSVILTDEPSRSAALFAVRAASESGCMISFDPNYRKPLWKSEEDAVRSAKSILPYCSILKVSGEELWLLTGCYGIEAGMKRLADDFGIPLVFTTMGPQGCRWLFDRRFGERAAYEVKTIDTTGAGDSFVAAVLSRIVCQYGGIERLGSEDIEKIADFACAASSLATTGSGAIPAMPDTGQVEALIRQGQ